MENKQKIEKIKKVLDCFKKFENHAISFYIRRIEEIDKIVNEK